METVTVRKSKTSAAILFGSKQLRSCDVINCFLYSIGTLLHRSRLNVGGGFD